MHQGGGGDEAHRETLLAGRQSQAQGDVGLTRAAGTQGDDILPPVDPVAPGQFQRLHLVQSRDRLEVKAVETFGRRELRRLNPALDHPTLPVDHLQFHQPAKKLNMVQPLGRALTRQLVVFPQHRRQLQSLEVVGQKEIGRFGHDPSPDTKHM